MDEVSLYLFMKWEKSEQTWLEKWKGQSTTFTKKVDRTRQKRSKTDKTEQK